MPWFRTASSGRRLPNAFASSKAKGRRIAPPAFAISEVSQPYWADVVAMSVTSIETPGPIVDEIAIFLT